jgi:hypothetical protein
LPNFGRDGSERSRGQRPFTVARVFAYATILALAALEESTDIWIAFGVDPGMHHAIVVRASRWNAEGLACG